MAGRPAGQVKGSFGLSEQVSDRHRDRASAYFVHCGNGPRDAIIQLQYLKAHCRHDSADVLTKFMSAMDKHILFH